MLGAVIFMGIVGGFMGLVVFAALGETFKQRKRRAQARRALQALAETLRGDVQELRDGSDVTRSVRGALKGRRCRASLRTRYVPNRDGGNTRYDTLNLSVTVEGLDPAALRSIWSDPFAPFEHRRAGRCVVTEGSPERFLLSGNASPLHEVFSRGLPAQVLTDLVGPGGRQGEALSFELGFEADGEAWLETDVNAHAVGPLEPALEALVTVATWRPE